MPLLSPWFSTSLSRHNASNSGLAPQFVHEFAHLGSESGTRHIRSERAHDEPRDAFPIVLLGPDGGIAEQELQDIALAGRQRAVVGQHDSGGAVPRDHIPDGGLDDCRTRFERIEQVLQAGVNAFDRFVAHFGRPPEAQHEEMLAFGIRQHQCAGDAVEHFRRWRAAPPLFEPRVPGRADMRALRDLFRRRPGVRLRPEYPKPAGSSRERRLLRKSPSDRAVLTDIKTLLVALP